MLCLTLSLASGAALADRKAERQAEIVEAVVAALGRFDEAQPMLKRDVERAPGYAVCTTYGLSFIVGGEGGKGLVHDNASARNMFMSSASASVGAQMGAAQNIELILFEDAASVQRLVDEGWTASVSGTAAAGARGHTVGAGAGSSVLDRAAVYMLPKNGVERSLAPAGTKYWRDDELN